MTSSFSDNGLLQNGSSNGEEVHNSSNSLLIFSDSSHSDNQSTSSSLTSLDTVVNRVSPVDNGKTITTTWQSSIDETPTLTPPALVSQSTSCSSTSYTDTSSQSTLSPTESSTSIESSSYSHSTSSSSSSSTSLSTSLNELSSSSTSLSLKGMPQKPMEGNLKSPDCAESPVNIGATSSPPECASVGSEKGSCCRHASCKCCQYCSWHDTPEPIVLMACGSFNPITTMHLRMMELARDAVERTYSFPEQQPTSSSEVGKGPFKDDSTEDYLCRTYLTRPPRRQVVVAGLFSVVSDGYAKAGLAPADTRCRLARLAAATTSDWLAVDSWEASQSEWSTTRSVLEHAQSRLDELTQLSAQDLNNFLTNTSLALKMEDPQLGEIAGKSSDVYHGSATNSWLISRLLGGKTPSSIADGTHEEQPVKACQYPNKRIRTSEQSELQHRIPQARVKLVCGADLLQSFATPNLWSEEDMTVIARDFGIICISRPHSDAARLLFEMDILSRYEQNVVLVTEWCQNGLSATLVRRALARGQSVRYLVPDAALEEIYAAGLYGAYRRQKRHPGTLPICKEVAEEDEALTGQSLMPDARYRIAQPSSPTATSSQFQTFETDDQLLTPEGVDQLIRTDVLPQTPHIEPSTSITFQERAKVEEEYLVDLNVPDSTQMRKRKMASNRHHIRLRNRSVQTRLSSIPSPNAPIVLRRVIIDPSISDKQHKAEHGELEDGDSTPRDFNEGLTAILPLLKQCTRCGSQRVRFLLIERPPVLVNTSGPTPLAQFNAQPLPTLHKVPAHRPSHTHAPIHVVPSHSSTPRSQQRRTKTQLEQLSTPYQRSTPTTFSSKRQQQPKRYYTQPICPPSTRRPLSGEDLRIKPPPPASVKFCKYLPKDADVKEHLGDISRQRQPQKQHPQPSTSRISAFSTNLQPTMISQECEFRSAPTLCSRGHSVPWEVLRRIHESHSAKERATGIQDHSSSSLQRRETLRPARLSSRPEPPKLPSKRRTKASAQQFSYGASTSMVKSKIPPEPRLAGDGAPASDYQLQFSHLQNRRSRPTSASEPLRVNIPPRGSSGSRAQTSQESHSRHGRTYDEVDILLYNLCLNIESAL